MSKFLKIPLQAGIADQQLDIILDEQPLTIRVTWNGDGEYWYFTLSHRNGDTILNGIKMVKNIPLISRYQIKSPPGDFIFLDNNSNKERPDFYSLGNDYLFLYKTQY
ncbi:hypothetical protein EKN56_13315 [Limnobaculum zhutongyuii]|uniref:Cyanophage baseplate Pam3 plug gp18 domain-containing protein n=1 Tax=Limnobaculum zhutongyuii TaxID=2498113 RepID=A0A411WM15_9GAMM|nr:hypothetical protein [Limnobaculum zhutongyuii]QBH97291.1 hypothetical protein EKN56_13315 [Limnobaculum zhutongyuii]TQS90763.1 hypothetical protein ELQ32_00040 [Limnobaculum zhutongyuii]